MKVKYSPKKFPTTVKSLIFALVVIIVPAILIITPTFLVFYFTHDKILSTATLFIMAIIYLLLMSVFDIEP